MHIFSKIPRSFKKDPFKKWYLVLILLNEKPDNKKLAIEYFSREFSASKKDFYEFIHLLKKYLKTGYVFEIREEIAKKYLEILSVLCDKFGFFEEKSEMDDLSFKIIEPQKHEEIKQILKEYKKNSQKIIQNILQKLRRLLKKNDYSVRVSGRYKSLYSIYRKNLIKKKKCVLQLNDIFAFRVIVEEDNVQKCFSILNLFHDTFVPVPKYFKDYITIPKINGYKSLHTGLNKVIPRFDLPIEVQIRTALMDEYAEKGLAAHWLYGRNKTSLIPTKREEMLLNSFLSKNELEALKNRQFVFCFSPKGDIFQLKKGASIIDFANKIHTKILKKVIGVRVNNEEKKINYWIKNGDIIELIFASGELLHKNNFK